MWTGLTKTKYERWQDGEEWPMWGPLLRDVERHPKAYEAIYSDIELLNILGEFFTPIVCSSIANHMKEISNSWLGAEYYLRGTYSAFISGLVQALSQELARGVGEDGGKNVLNESNEVSSQHEDSTERRKLKKSQGDEETGLMYETNGSGGDKDLGYFKVGLNGTLAMRKVRVTDIDLGPWISSENPDTPQDFRVRRVIIGMRSECFASEGFIASLMPVYQAVSVNPYVYVFHGSRSRHLRSFRLRGLCPINPVSEFSIKPALYLTNDIRVAFEQPLLHHPAVHKDRTLDTVMVMAFRVPVNELHGEILPSGGHKKMRCHYFPSANDEWQDYVHFNWNKGQGDWNKGQGDNYDNMMRPNDIVIGPICSIPKQGEQKFGCVEKNSKIPLQLAFQSRYSREWLAQFLVSIFREGRHATSESASTSSGT